MTMVWREAASGDGWARVSYYLESLAFEADFIRHLLFRASLHAEVRGGGGVLDIF